MPKPTIEAIDFFYLSNPQILDIADGSQDALLVRIQGAGVEGWGECEASPLVSIASWKCPMSHSACKPLSQSYLGKIVGSPEDIKALHHLARSQSLDLLQADHTLSGIDIALWDWLGKVQERPTFELLGFKQSFSKRAYASTLFGQTPEETYQKALEIKDSGFTAAKFGWGSFGQKDVQWDEDLIQAAREGLGSEHDLFIDAGTVWKENVQEAQQRLPTLKKHNIRWLEEPFENDALLAYSQLSKLNPHTPLATGEGCHCFLQAKNLIEFGDIDYIQIDPGRVGGLTSAHRVALLAQSKGIQFVNHTFTSTLALASALQPYLGIEEFELCEYPVSRSEVARAISPSTLNLNAGWVTIPEGPGLGVIPDLKALAPYEKTVEIKIDHELVFKSKPIL